jgi:hypothetical protein
LTGSWLKPKDPLIAIVKATWMSASIIDAFEPLAPHSAAVL